MNKKPSSHIYQINKVLLDFVPAFLGVLVALFLNNWQQNSKDKAFINSSIRSISADCKENIANIKEQKAHLKNHVDTFKYYLNDPSVTIFNLVDKNNGLQIMTSRNSGWEILEKSTLITNIDYETLTLMYEVDNSISLINHLTKTLSDNLYSTINSGDLEDKKTAIIQLLDMQNAFYGLEKGLVKVDSIIHKEYSNVLKKQ